MSCVAQRQLLCNVVLQLQHGSPGRNALQRLYSTFPGGLPGSALVLMRAVVGATASAQGMMYLSNGGNRTFEGLFTSLALAGCGACLAIGFLTPAVTLSIAIISFANALSWLPLVAGNLVDGKLASIEMIVMAVALALLGPGAYSLDAILFGRHEIVIPPVSRTPRS